MAGLAEVDRALCANRRIAGQRSPRETVRARTRRNGRSSAPRSRIPYARPSRLFRTLVPPMMIGTNRGSAARVASLPPRGKKTSETIAPQHPCIGLEAEFSLYVDGQKRLPEHVFRNPRHVVREKMIPRAGRSWHLPSGGALYFDTGVIEVATPIIEIAPGCCARAGRSLWEQIAFVRDELDAWEGAHGRTLRLEGFSAHYNISVEGVCRADRASMHRLALLLTYMLHPPVMLLAANRLSTGVGVRPREGRIEVTVDFTPDPDLMIATASLITGTV